MPERPELLGDVKEVQAVYKIWEQNLHHHHLYNKKHFKVQSYLQAKEDSRRGPAKFLPEYQSGHEWVKLQQEAMNKGIKTGRIFRSEDNKGNYYMYVDMEKHIGFYEGKEASYLRLEITKSSPHAVHSHPVNGKSPQLAKILKLFK